jgi:hypothetical protein
LLATTQYVTIQNNMNRKLSAKAIQRGLCVGALLLSAAAASASSTLLTFQIDMTEAISNSIFDPAIQTIAVRGTFDGWATPGFGLTNNPSGANTNLYTGVFNDTTDANGAVTAWQIVILTNGVIDTYSSQNDGDNYCAALPTNSGASLVTPSEFWDDDGPLVTNSITFQVDMAQQLQLGTFSTSDSVFCQGSFEGWNDSFQLTNNPALNVTNGQGIPTSLPYQGTYTTWSADANAEAEFKYVYNNETGGGDQYENVSAANADPDSHNRFFINKTQVLPLVFYSDQPFVPPITNVITFEVDMSAQIEVGAFTTNDSVILAGNFNDWNTTAQIMSNNPAGGTPNIYSTALTNVNPPGTQLQFKFVIQPGKVYENLANNRTLNLLETNGSFTFGPVYFNDQPPEPFDFVSVTNCMVTFTVNMTNAVGTDGVVFDGSGYPVYLNGLNGGINNNFWTWGALQPTTYEMTNIPGTDLYSITLPVNQGQNMDLLYKYSINGIDDEAGFADNHERWIRSLPNYTMPVDIFGSQGTNTQSEIAFGDLAIAQATNNQIHVAWLGRDGVHLQTASTLNPGTVWTNQYLTDGTNLLVAPGGMAGTNYPVGQGNLFYRLIGPE